MSVFVVRMLWYIIYTNKTVLYTYNTIEQCNVAMATIYVNSEQPINQMSHPTQHLYFIFFIVFLIRLTGEKWCWMNVFVCFVFTSFFQKLPILTSVESRHDQSWSNNNKKKMQKTYKRNILLSFSIFKTKLWPHK